MFEDDIITACREVASHGVRGGNIAAEAFHVFQENAGGPT